MLRVISCIFGVCALLCSLTAQAHAAYPERPVTVIVGFGAGGATDIMGRAFAELLGKELGATFIIKNVASARRNWPRPILTATRWVICLWRP